MADVTMPQLGETVTEGTITKWMKKVGDKIDADEVLFEVSTDKVDSEVPSPAAGYIAEILVEEGETVDVGVKLAVISSDAPADGDGSAPAEVEEEPGADATAKAEPEAEAKTEAEAQTEAEPAPEPEPRAEEEPAPEPAADAEPEPDEPEPEREPEPARAESGSSKAGTRPSDDRPRGRPSGGGGSGKVLSPVVRRLIAEHDLDANSIEGTGAGGRVTRADVLKMIDGGAQKPKAAPTEAKEASAETKAAPAPKERESAPARQAPAPAAKAGERDEVIAFSNIRKRTAEHMVRSKATSAHTLVVIEVDYDGVERVRRAVKDRFRSEEGVGLSYLPFISRAVVDAVREFPNVNASVGDNELIVHHDVNLGVAVDLNYEGLIVPVVHGADGLRMRALAREIAGLADKARSKKLGMDEIAGGTFTITNAGGYGTFITGPIINQPQVAILSTDGVKMRPVAVEVDEDEYAIAVHPVGNLALAWDHRAFDGAYASAFLAKVKDILETRDWSQEL